MAANWYVVEPLYAFNYSDYSMYNALAKGEPVKVSDTEYTVVLRDGAKFSDGKPVTANDVVKSYERSNKEGGLYSPMISFIDSVEAKTDQEVTFNLKYPFPAFKERLALIKVAPASMSNDELTAQPIGSGPWKYANITDQKVTFVKNDLYNGDYPAQCKNMVWNVAVDDTARVTAMQTGKVDVMELVPTLAFDVLQKKAELKTVQSFNAPYIMFNTKQKPFDDPRVRQAVFYAIDAKQLIDNQMAGQATPTTSYLIEEYPQGIHGVRTQCGQSQATARGSRRPNTHQVHAVLHRSIVDYATRPTDQEQPGRNRHGRGPAVNGLVRPLPEYHRPR